MVADTLTMRRAFVFCGRERRSALEILQRSARRPRGPADYRRRDARMNGTALAGRASKIAPLLKILFMSGYTEDVIMHHGMHSGGAGFIQKPFAPGNLVRKVRALIDGKKTMTAGDSTFLP